MKTLSFRLEEKNGRFHLYVVRPDGAEVWVAVRNSKSEIRELLGG